MHVTQLAHGKISNTDEMLIELRESDNEPAAVLIHWPAAASVASPATFPARPARSRPLLPHKIYGLPGCWLARAVREAPGLAMPHPCGQLASA
jgi:hypothetical protein